MAVPPVQYADRIDLGRYGLTQDVLAGFKPSEIEGALIGASAVASDALGNQYTLPILTPFPLSLIRAVCQIAAADLMMVRGTSSESYPVWETRAKEAREWLRGVRQGDFKPVGLIDSTAREDDGGPRATSKTPEGW